MAQRRGRIQLGYEPDVIATVMAVALVTESATDACSYYTVCTGVQIGDPRLYQF